MALTYRVVETKDGWFKCQHRIFFFWWMDSMHAPSQDKEEQIEFAKYLPAPRTKQIRRIVWP